VDKANTSVAETISLEQYFAEGHVCIKHHGDQYFESWFPAEMGGDQRKIEITTEFFTLVPQLVVGTDRIATIHHRLASYYKNILPIRLVTPDFEIPVLKETLQYHQYRDLDPACYWLRSVLQDAANSLKE
jgi:LysR family nod box-dependent transcriptional activator